MPTLKHTDAMDIIVARTDSFWNMSEMTPMTMGMKQPKPRPRMQRVAMMPHHGRAEPRMVGRPPTTTRAVAKSAHTR